MTDIRERVLNAEEAARWGDAANDSADLDSETGFWRTGAFVLSILALAAICFCAGAFLAAAWEVSDAAPPRGVMDH